MKRNYLLAIVIVATIISSCDNTKISSENSAEKKPTPVTINKGNKSATQADSDFTNAASEKTIDEVLPSNNKEPWTTSGLTGQSGKPFQEYTITSKRDTTILCKEGTVLKIKANSFLLCNSMNPVNGDLTIKIKEYYKISDMVLANLSTTANNEILETGGMLYIEVLNNGQQCQIKDGAFIQFGFPDISAKDNMQLFKGKTDNNNNIDWILINTAATDDSSAIFTVVEEMPVFIGGDAARIRYFAQNIKYPQIAKEMGICGTVFVTFIVNEDGRVSGARILRGIGGGCDEAALSVVSGMPNWLPGKQKGKPVNVQFNMPITFSLSDTLVAAAFKKIDDEAYNDSLVTGASLGFIDNYLLSSTKLGWINCDRFINQFERTNYSILVNNPEELNICIVFHRYKSILSGSVENNEVIFRNVPINENITIVATKIVGNSTYLATKQTVTSSKTETELSLRPVTYGELKSEVEKLNDLK